MGMIGTISQYKERFKAARMQKKEIAMEKMKQETIKLREQAKVERAHGKILKEVHQLKQERFQRRIAPVQKFAKGLKSTIKEVQGMGKGIDFGGSGRDSFGGKGADIFGSKKQPEKIERPKQITIKL